MPDILADLKSDPAYRALPVAEQLIISDQLLNKRLSQDPEFIQLQATDQMQIKKVLLARSPTFSNPNTEADLKTMGEGYIRGAAGEESAKSAYQFVHGMIRGSGIASYINKMVDEGTINKGDDERGLEYYKSLDRMQGKGSGWATAGEMIGGTAEMIAISVALTPVSAAVKNAAVFGLRGGQAGLAAVNTARATAGLGKASVEAMVALHPALEMVSFQAADALVTAGPLFLADEMKRAGNGETSVVSEGAGEVLRTLGENAAGNFLWGAVQGGLFMTAGQLGKSIFHMKPDNLYEALSRTMKDNDSVLRSFLANPDPLMQAKMTPYQLASNKQLGNILESLKHPDFELNPLAKSQTLAQQTGKVVERTDAGSYRIWEGGRDGTPTFKEFNNFNDANNDLAYKTYQRYKKLPGEQKANFAGEQDKWFIERGMALENQDQLLYRDNSIDLDKDLKDAALAGFDVRSPKERIVITKAEADGFGNSDPLAGAYIQTKKPIEEGMLNNAKEGEFNLFKSEGPVRVSPSDDPNMVFIGRRGATPEQYDLATVKANEIIKTDPLLSIDDARANYLLNRGLDYFAHADGSYEFFTPRNGKLLGSATDVIDSVGRNAKKVGANSNQDIIIEAVGKIKVGAKEFVGDTRLVGKAATQALHSKDPEEMKSFVKLYLEGYGKTADVQTYTKADMASDKVIDIKQDSVRVFIPTGDMTFAQERKYMATLFDQLKAATGNVKGTHKGEYFAKQMDLILKRPVTTKFKLPSDVGPVDWLSDVAKKLGGSYEPPPPTRQFFDGGTMKLASGERHFSTIDEAVDFISRKAADPKQVANELRMQGIGLKGTEGNYVAYSLSTGKPLASATDAFGIMEKLDVYPAYLDNKYGPSRIQYVDGKIEFTLAGQKVAKNPAEAAEILRQFRDTALLAEQSSLKLKPNAEFSVDAAKNYRVYLKDYDYVKTFGNVHDARVFFEKDVPTWNTLKEIANKKHADLTIEAGRYKLRDGDTVTFANSVDELADQLKRIPDLEEHAPSIMDELDPSIDKDVVGVTKLFNRAKRLYAGTNPKNLPPQVDMDPKARHLGAWLTARSATSQFTSWIRDVANRTNRPNLLKHVTALQDSIRLAHVDSIIGDKYIIDAFQVNGKVLPIESRQNIFYYMGQKNSEKAAKGLGIQHVEKFGGAIKPLTSEELQVADKLETFLGNMSKKFGIEMNELIFKYMPMIRDFNAPKNAGLLATLKTADDLAYAATGGNVPASLKFFADNERLDGIFQYTVKDDPLELLMLYNAQGHKKMYMNENWKKLSAYIKNDPVQDMALVNRINIYRDQVMGYYHSPGEDVVAQFGEKFMVGLKDAPIIGATLKDVSKEELASWGKNILRNTMSVSYMVQLGFKPWSAIRNSVQSMTTLAPRFGTARTLKAYKAVLEGGNEFFDGLRLRGIITEAPPIVDELASGASKLGKATQASLQWLKNGDDLSRAVAYKVGMDSYQQGLDWLAVHPKDIKGFQQISGLSVIDPVSRNMFTDMTLKGQTLAAQDSYAAMIVKDTAFTNDAAESSMMRHGLIGKLWGQYGSYSESYRANMFNMVKYGSPADRVRMVGTYLAICGVMTSTFASMGIKTNDFLPTGPAFFSGGPSFQLGVTAMKSPQMILDWASGNWNMTDATTLNQLKFQAGGMVPLAYQVRYMKKAAEYYKAGDQWKGWLSLTGVPTIPD